MLLSIETIVVFWRDMPKWDGGDGGGGLWKLIIMIAQNSELAIAT